MPYKLMWRYLGQNREMQSSWVGLSAYATKKEAETMRKEFYKNPEVKKSKKIYGNKLSIVVVKF